MTPSAPDPYEMYLLTYGESQELLFISVKELIDYTTEKKLTGFSVSRIPVWNWTPAKRTEKSETVRPFEGLIPLSQTEPET